MLGRLLLPLEIWHENRRKVLEKMYRQVKVEGNLLNLDVGCGDSFILGEAFDPWSDTRTFRLNVLYEYS